MVGHVAKFHHFLRWEYVRLCTTYIFVLVEGYFYNVRNIFAKLKFRTPRPLASILTTLICSTNLMLYELNMLHDLCNLSGLNSSKTRTLAGK